VPGNSFGEQFRITTFGESHGGGVGVVVDGCPAGHPFPNGRVMAQLARRRPGQKLTSQRRESDEIEVLSGLDPESGRTLGTPLAMMVRNKDARSDHYGELKEIYRPSHADYTYDARFGLRFVAGGGRASARETVARVAAGALAEDLLETARGVSIVAWVASVHDVEARIPDVETLTRAEIDRHAVRCPDEEAASAMTERIEAARRDGDSVGGVLRCVARGVPPGWGAPVFDKLTAELAHAMMSIPASRGFEVGEGFGAARMRGSEHNDAFEPDPDGRSGGDGIRTRTNHSGGIQGGISNGEIVSFAVAFKPVATIFKPQDTVNRTGEPVTFEARGRHDPCVLPRAVPIVEAMTALVLCDHMLRRQVARVGDLRR
jgi:chorismate synthase